MTTKTMLMMTMTVPQRGHSRRNRFIDRETNVPPTTRRARARRSSDRLRHGKKHPYAFAVAAGAPSTRNKRGREICKANAQARPVGESSPAHSPTGRDLGFSLVFESGCRLVSGEDDRECSGTPQDTSRVRLNDQSSESGWKRPSHEYTTKCKSLQACAASRRGEVRGSLGPRARRNRLPAQHSLY